MTVDDENRKGEAAAAAAKPTTLADVLTERGALPEPELLNTFLEVLGDLESAHGEGMFHRDISPARIVLDGEGWKLTDYGRAKVGTVRYMSPERCQGQPMDARSDIYSLGVVLFHAATGRVPFDAEMKFQIMEAHAGTPPPSPRTVNPAVSEELEQVTLRALAKDPADRFQTAAEFKHALEAMVPVPDQPSVQPAEPVPEPEVKREAESETEPVWSAPEVEPGREPRRVKPVVILVPLAAAIAVVAGLLLTGVIGARRVPQVTGMNSGEAEQLLRGRGLRAETDSMDDTLAVGTVVMQVPRPGVRASRSRVVKLTVSTGAVAVPVLAGATLADARARLTTLALPAGKVDSQYSDKYAAGVVVSSGLKAGTKVAPHSSVGLTVSAGRATCPQCGTRREARAKFCTKCGFQY